MKKLNKIFTIVIFIIYTISIIYYYLPRDYTGKAYSINPESIDRLIYERIISLGTILVIINIIISIVLIIKEKPKKVAVIMLILNLLLLLIPITNFIINSTESNVLIIYEYYSNDPVRVNYTDGKTIIYYDDQIDIISSKYNDQIDIENILLENKNKLHKNNYYVIDYTRSSSAISDCLATEDSYTTCTRIEITNIKKISEYKAHNIILTTEE